MKIKFSLLALVMIGELSHACHFKVDTAILEKIADMEYEEITKSNVEIALDEGIMCYCKPKDKNDLHKLELDCYIHYNSSDTVEHVTILIDLIFEKIFREILQNLEQVSFPKGITEILSEEDVGHFKYDLASGLLETTGIVLSDVTSSFDIGSKGEWGELVINDVLKNLNSALEMNYLDSNKYCLMKDMLKSEPWNLWIKPTAELILKGLSKTYDVNSFLSELI